jgi:hypothetical protein
MIGPMVFGFDPAEEPDARPQDPNAFVATLREWASLVHEENPFQCGDLVTFRQHIGADGVGLPSVVLESLAPGMEYRMEGGSVKVNLRILTLDQDGCVRTGWTDSWRLERWTPEMMRREPK